MKYFLVTICIVLCSVWVSQAIRVSPSTQQQLLSRMKRQYGGYGGGYNNQAQQESQQQAYDQQQQYQQQQQDQYNQQQQYQQDQETQREEQEQQYEQQEQQYEDQQRDYQQQRQDEQQQRYQQQMDSYSPYGRYRRSTGNPRVKRQSQMAGNHHYPTGSSSAASQFMYPAATQPPTYMPVSIYEINYSMCRYLLEIILSLLQDEYIIDDTQTATPLETDPALPVMQPGLVVATATPLNNQMNDQYVAVPADVAQVQMAKNSDGVQVDGSILEDDTDLMIDVS